MKKEVVDILALATVVMLQVVLIVVVMRQVDAKSSYVETKPLNSYHYFVKFDAKEDESKVEEKQRYSDEDVDLLARLISSEAGGDTKSGKLAVGSVVMNRLEDGRYGDTLKDVIYADGQFSVVSNGTIENEPNEESIDVAKQILKNGARGVPSDVFYFWMPEAVESSNWTKKMHETSLYGRIGEHYFYVK